MFKFLHQFKHYMVLVRAILDREDHFRTSERCDFYIPGRQSGCGGMAIWEAGRPYHPEVIDRYRIIPSQHDHIRYDIAYYQWRHPNLEMTEHRVVQILQGHYHR